MNTPSKNPQKQSHKGDIKIKATVFVIPLHTSASCPVFASADPINPPIRACDELVGSPRYHVIKSHTIAPTSVANIISGIDNRYLYNPFADGIRDMQTEKEKRDEVEEAAHATA